MAHRCRLLPIAVALAAACWRGGPASAQSIRPVAVASAGIAGFNFPETEARITGWTTSLGTDPEAEAAITRHAWGIWTALTRPTNQFHSGQRLRVFETWQTPQDLAGTATMVTSIVRRAGPQPRRLAVLQGLPGGRRSGIATQATESDRAVGYVKFDPVAAAHVVAQDLLNPQTLQTLLTGGAAAIPPFPAAALVAKAIFRVIPASALVDGRYYPLPAWEGPPAQPQAFPPEAWPGVVWVDVATARGGSQAAVAVDRVAMPDGSSRTAANTAPLSAFISFRLSAADAAGLNADKPGTDAAAGDVALLVGMHVAGRELSRWTWQTYWWTADADAPAAPSSAAAAALRPEQLTGAARHYAVATAYTMALPSPPVLGGDNAGRAVYAYNPYVEAPLSSADLPDSVPGLAPDGTPAGNNQGVQTNCMSCHIRATFNPSRLPTAPRFAAARYTDLGDSLFVGTLQTDFLWSVARAAQSP